MDRLKKDTTLLAKICSKKRKRNGEVFFLPHTTLSTCFLLLIICPFVRAQPIANDQPKQLPDKEVNALNSIKTKLGGITSNWPSPCRNETEAPSPTIRRNCESESVCHVTELILNNRDLYGVIPQELADLTYLQQLDLSGNQLHGPMPPFLGNLTQLTSLDLSHNNLGGHIPEFSSQMRLRSLSLVENRFEGQIPRSLGQMPSLIYLKLSYNFLVGPLPQQLGNISTLVTLELSFNLLKGPLPQELGNISTLEDFDFAGNMIDGVIPESMGKWTKLQHFWASDNGLSGTLPKTFQNLSSLQFFGIRGNNIGGQIPEFIKNWKQLKYLYLIGNNFEGPLPSGISSLVQLRTLYINDMRSEVNSPFPKLSELKALTSLVLQNCTINDTIPGYVAEELRSLTYLDLSFNRLTGKIPDSFRYLKLNTMYLTGNMLNGTIPAWITNSSSSMDLSFNNFSSVNLTSLNKQPNVNLFGCCTAATPNVSSTQRIMDTYCPKAKPKYDTLYINCGGHQTNIEGHDYEEDLSPGGGSTSYVSPSGKWAYSSTGDYTLSSPPAQYIQNLTCGLSVPDAPLYSTARLSSLSLKYFGFCLHNDIYEVKLHFAEIVYTDDNYFAKRVFDIIIQGEKKLEAFTISEPKKPIVKNFSAVVRNNVLEIHLYWAGKGSVNIQPRLYGPLLSAISVTRATQSSRKDPHKIIIVVTLVSLIFIVLVLALFREKGWLGGRSIPQDGIELQGNCFSLQQIKTATQNFNPNNKISEGHFGAVYKGQLPLSGTEIAVKQISSTSERRIHKFAFEVGTMASIQHPNLVRLLGYCNEANQLLVIYEFKGEYSLAHVLYGSEASRISLDWPTRYNICLGIAKGLACLHEFNIIHSDIKATNILLDRDFNGGICAKISEFGLAKLYEGDDKPIVNKTTGIHGYMAPEYAVHGILTDKADVYSFGVLTLEIVSGKSNAVHRTNQESVYLVDEAYVLQQDNNLVTLIDRALQFNYVVGEATRILDLAMSCLNHSPTLRPKMSDVVTILEGKMPTKVPSRAYSGILSTCILQTSTSSDGGHQISEETQNMI